MEAEYVAAKPLADAEARRLDREENAEKYAAEDEQNKKKIEAKNGRLMCASFQSMRQYLNCRFHYLARVLRLVLVLCSM